MSDKWLEVLFDGRAACSINVSAYKRIAFLEMNQEINIERDLDNLFRETGRKKKNLDLFDTTSSKTRLEVKTLTRQIDFNKTQPRAIPFPQPERGILRLLWKLRLRRISSTDFECLGRVRRLCLASPAKFTPTGSKSWVSRRRTANSWRDLRKPPFGGAGWSLPRAFARGRGPCFEPKRSLAPSVCRSTATSGASSFSRPRAEIPSATGFLGVWSKSSTEVLHSVRHFCANSS